ncbi:MAG: hypothetical protein M1338_05225 [Patescibacteria group bacterium]|nr:hypothetical protein [Patescibacteria group bacterium]
MNCTSCHRITHSDFTNFDVAASGAITVAAAQGLTTNGAGALNLGTSAATSIAMGSASITAFGVTTANTGTITLGTATMTTGTTTIYGGTGAGAISLTPGDAGLITIGRADGTGLITVGASSAAQELDLGTGSGNATIKIGTGNGINPITIGGTGANVIQIGNTQTGGSVTMGNAMTTGTIQLGGTSMAAGTTIIYGGTGVGAIQLINAANGVITIGNTAAAGTVTVGQSSATQAVNIGTGEGATTVSIATGATNAKTVTIGSTTGASSLALKSGTAGIVLTGPVAGGSPDTITNASVAISVTTLVTYVNSSGGVIAATIADGINGQIKYLSMVTAGNAMTLDNTNLNGTSLVLDAVGEAATLVFDTTTNKWSVTGTTGTYTP